MSILSGIHVLDFTHFIAGPFCSQILGDHGAHVIKVERIEGETGRLAEPFHNGSSLYFAAQNRNKRGISIDLKSPNAQDIIERLVKKADLLVTNYTADVPKRLGIDFETISKINPKISMVHITGFGLTGSYRNYTAYDGVIQAMSGIASLTGHPGNPPTNVGTYVADQLTGLQAAMGAMLALFYREKTGKGKYVDISMLDGMISMLGHRLTEVMATGTENEQRYGNRDPRALANTFPTKDGFIYIQYQALPMWEQLCRIMKREEWLKSDSPFFSREDRIENRDILEGEIAEWTKQYTKYEVFEVLQQAGIACGPVNTLQDIIHNSQVKDRDMLRKMELGEQGDAVFVNGTPIKINDVPMSEFTPPPAIGEHTETILRELGYSEKEIDNFKSNNVVGYN